MSRCFRCASFSICNAQAKPACGSLWETVLLNARVASPIFLQSRQFSRFHFEVDLLASDFQKKITHEQQY